MPPWIAGDDEPDDAVAEIADAVEKHDCQE
jgi:hypothetical protein